MTHITYIKIADIASIGTTSYLYEYYYISKDDVININSKQLNDLIKNNKTKYFTYYENRSKCYGEFYLLYVRIYKSVTDCKSITADQTDKEDLDTMCEWEKYTLNNNIFTFPLDHIV